MTVADDDRAAEKVAKGPRVSLKQIEGSIAEEYSFVLGNAIDAINIVDRLALEHPTRLMTICVLVMQNGFTVIGTSSPAAPENFNEDLGKKFARDNAIRQLWPLMGFALRERLAKRSKPPVGPLAGSR